MKLNEFIDATGEIRQVIEESTKENNPNVFTVATGHGPLYEDFSSRGPDALREGPLDIADLLKSKLYTKYGESNLGPNSMKIRTAFKFIGRNAPIAKMSGWDGGLMTRDIINILTPKINEYFGAVASGQADPFSSYDWKGLYEEVKEALISNTEVIQQRIDAGRDDKLPSAKALLPEGELGATLAEFVAFLFVDNFQRDYLLNTREKSKSDYVKQLKSMKIFSQTDIASPEKEIDTDNINPEAGFDGFQGAYNQ